MESKFLEVTDGSAWGKFLLARPTASEWATRSFLFDPAVEEYAVRTPLMGLRGHGRDQVWILDLATGMGVRFDLRNPSIRDGRSQMGKASAAGVHVCWLFPVMVEAVFEFARVRGSEWWEVLPPALLVKRTSTAVVIYPAGEDLVRGEPGVDDGLTYADLRECLVLSPALAGSG